MAIDDLSPIAKLHAERILRGEGVSDTEMRIVTAGLMLSVDELAHVVKGLTTRLWTDEQLRIIMRDEVSEWADTHLRKIVSEEMSVLCAARSREFARENGGTCAAWLGRLFRGFAGLKCLSIVGMVIIALMYVTGCAAYDVRIEDHEEGAFKQLYPATSLEAETALYLCSEWQFGFIYAIPLMLDLPFSILTDTLCFPCDVARCRVAHGAASDTTENANSAEVNRSTR